MRKSLFVGIAAAVSLVAIAPTTASAGGATQAKPTLADILLSDSAKDDANGFDDRWWDYDIVTQALLLFPDLVEAASNPDAELTAFLPNDRAFRRLVFQLTGERLGSEAEVFAVVASLGTDTVKTVLTYHIVPAKISYSQALHADGAVLGTLQGGTVEVKVRDGSWRPIRLIDADTNDRNPRVIRGDVGGEASNGYAHAIDRVLRPVDLP